MESNKLTIAALLFIVMILGVNFFMYGIARGIFRQGKKNPFEIIGRAFSPARKNQKEPMEELREKISELKDVGEEDKTK